MAKKTNQTRQMAQSLTIAGSRRRPNRPFYWPSVAFPPGTAACKIARSEPGQPGATKGPDSGLPLGPPLDIRKVAELIGCSPWTVRQRLLPSGLPHFRSGAGGRLIFYRDQVVRWIQNKQKGGH
jgi:hypothetical protein